jgi:hypothetical protein
MSWKRATLHDACRTPDLFGLTARSGLASRKRRAPQHGRRHRPPTSPALALPVGSGLNLVDNLERLKLEVDTILPLHFHALTERELRARTQKPIQWHQQRRSGSDWVDYYEVGHDAGAIAARVLKEEAPGDIPVIAADATLPFRSIELRHLSKWQCCNVTRRTLAVTSEVLIDPRRYVAHAILVESPVETASAVPDMRRAKHVVQCPIWVIRG